MNTCLKKHQQALLIEMEDESNQYGIFLIKF